MELAYSYMEFLNAGRTIETTDRKINVYGAIKLQVITNFYRVETSPNSNLTNILHRQWQLLYQIKSLLSGTRCNVSRQRAE